MQSFMAFLFKTIKGYDPSFHRYTVFLIEGVRRSWKHNNQKGFAICVHLLHAIVDFNYGKLIFVECELMIFIC